MLDTLLIRQLILITVSRLSNNNYNLINFFIKMPIFRLCTNLPRSKIPKNFHVELHKLIARMLQKPEKSVCVSIQPDELMLMQGTEEPAVSCSFLTIGRFGPEQNVGYSKELCTQIVDKLQVKPDRIKIHFIDEVSSNVGTEFTTVSNLQTP